jgi:2-C-methyl-D-erythritol 2,4-cyclodiphosphate synthase
LILSTRYKIGIGYDIHRLVKDKKLVLGGVEIPCLKGLDGHSDADVLLHAICDALLGAIGEPDIGEQFPNTDPMYQDISSNELLKKVYGLVDKYGFKVENLDTVVIAEQPKLSDFKSRMKKNISGILNISEDNVNIKAKTQEGLGFGSEQEAIAAYASVLISRE